MKSLKLSAWSLRSAMLCVAKNDPRKYLQNIILDARKGTTPCLFATNGHIFFKHELPEVTDFIDEDCFLLIKPFAIPAKCKNVIIEQKWEGYWATLLDKDDQPINEMRCYTVNDTYPEHWKIEIPTEQTAKLEEGIIGITTTYLQIIGKIFTPVIKLEFSGMSGLIKISEEHNPTAFVGLMPARII